MGQTPASLAVKAVRVENIFIISKLPYTPTWDCGGRRGSDGGEKCPYLWNILGASTERDCSGMATEGGTIHTLYSPEWREVSECGATCKEIGQPPYTDTVEPKHLEHGCDTGGASMGHRPRMEQERPERCGNSQAASPQPQDCATLDCSL